MKHRVKVVSAKNDVITLKVDGVLCSYLVQRPQPLTIADTGLLKVAMDTNILECMSRELPMYTLVGIWQRLLLKLRGLGGYVLTRVVHSDGRVFEEFVRPGCVSRSFGETVADYLVAIGVEVDIDKETKGVIILKSDVDKVREGNLI